MRSLVALILLLSLTATPAAESAEWQLDRSNSELGFVATYEGVGFKTRFEEFTARIDFEAGAPGDGRFEVLVQIASLNSRSKDRDEGMRDTEWFAAAAHPVARFETTAIEQLGPQSYQATGDLTIKGTTRTIRLPFTWAQEGNTARLRAEVTLDRIAFDIGSGEWATDSTIGFQVEVLGELSLTR